MTWHTYHIPPIDYAWGRLKTVDETAKELGGKSAWLQLHGAYGESAPDEDIAVFLASWTDAQAEARRVGWEGDHREKPVVFWLPNDTHFDCGFVIKQDNNGSTFVVSPHPLPHLQRFTL